jgi:hypothetical protein
MRSLLLVAVLIIGMAAGSDDFSLPGHGQELQTVAGSEPASQYQQYYDVAGSVPDESGTIHYMVSGSEPESLVVNGQSTTFDPNNVPMNSYWIQGSSSWTQYIKCPLYARFKLLAYTQGGTATVREDYPDGTQVEKDFQFYPGYTRQTFTADTVGRHVIGFEINGQMSNAIIVDVETAPSQQSPASTSQQSTVQVQPGSSGQRATGASGGTSQKADPGI